MLAAGAGFAAGESLAVLLIFGLGFSAIARLVTRGITPPVPRVQRNLNRVCSSGHGAVS